MLLVGSPLCRSPAEASLKPIVVTLALLALAIWGLLARLESAERRQREFAGNASHDLQSPLTVFRTELEVALAQADLEEWQRTGRRLVAESDRMEAIVGDLLFLGPCG